VLFPTLAYDARGHNDLHRLRLATNTRLALEDGIPDAC